MSWFKRQRREWIVETIRIFGFINREHIERKFEVTAAVASLDIRELLRERPDLMTYNASAKRYEARTPETYIGTPL